MYKGIKKLCIVILLASVISPSLLAFAAEEEEFVMKGRVVKYGSNSGIKNVTVVRKYKKDWPAKAVPTDENGYYSFKVPKIHEFVYLKYIPENPEEYNSQGREPAMNCSNPKILDTIGLASTLQACEDGHAARFAAWGCVNFVYYGGEREIANKFPLMLKAKNCTAAFEAIYKDERLVKELKKLELVEWFW